MTFPVPGVDAKLAGAQDRLSELERCINQGAVSDLMRFGVDRDRQGRVRIRVQEVLEVPANWHVWIGECIHDMRSALDHVAYALNITGSGEDPPPNWKKSQFPIYSDRGRFRAMCRQARKRPDQSPMGYFPRGTWTRIERLQPYHRWHDIDIRLLGVLGQLSDVDKHRRLPLTPLGPAMLEFPDEIEGRPITAIKTAPSSGLKASATIAWLDVPKLPIGIKQPQVPFAYAGALNFQREMANSKLPLIFEVEPARSVLSSILSRIRETVLPAFEPFLR